MTSASSLSLILRRLDEIERKLDRILEELRTHGHRLFDTSWQSSKEGLNDR
jgi:tetrahydromethanopterin S-methyltransferase subunit G